ncbi:TetR family transcriptional regulator [Streptomyces yokosukanensis]|uniref:TetR family transcriptional regulator n=1 Tax=Streptomyces yokosukanensis TaxID=67386 RepID=A0A101NQU6_9ACTN|nr:TetR/AcrR family transcriptional regulator [Streptomyces yokosukanensis]KUM97529.1 TetR family transcriptional regulator [Streptomyces yokosukanensis]
MPSQPSRAAYHHGDLRAACLRAARELLAEEGGAGLSLRAVARRAGVSPTAPYRHFADRQSLVSAVAAEGYRELAGYLAAAHPAPETPDDLAAVAGAYVRFALERPGLFRAMFAEPCDPDHDERVAANSVVKAYVEDLVKRAFPHTGADAGDLATAVWALVHGLAFLHIDSKLDASAGVDERVRAAVHALLTVKAGNRP